MKTKFVYEYFWSVENEAEGIATYPFEFSSKDDFILMVLEAIDKHKQDCINHWGKSEGLLYYRNGYIKILGLDLNVGFLEDSVEHNIFTLEEWFEKKKLKNEN